MGARNIVPIGCGIKWPSSLPSRHDSAVVESSRPGRRCDRRSSLIYRRSQLAVISRSLYVFILGCYRSEVAVARRNLIFGPGTGVDSAIAAVVADSIDHRVVYYRCVVNVAHVDDVHIVHRTVIEESSVVPPSALVSLAEITVAVRDPSVETDMRAPVTFVENKSVAAPAPIRRGPEISNLRRLYPGTGNPVVIAAVIVIGPIPRRPDVAISGTQRLLVHRQWGRTNGYRDTDLRE